VKPTVVNDNFSGPGGALGLLSVCENLDNNFDPDKMNQYAKYLGHVRWSRS